MKSVLAWERRGAATPSLISESEGLRWLTIVCFGDHGRGFLRCVSFELSDVKVRFSLEAHGRGDDLQ